MQNHMVIDSYSRDTEDAEETPQPYGSPRSEKTPTVSLGDPTKKFKSDHNFDRNQQEKNLLIRRDFPTEELMRQNPITLYDENKKIVYKKATKPRENNKIMCGTICYSRWSQLDDCLTMPLIARPSEKEKVKTNASSTTTNTNNSDNSNANTNTNDDISDLNAQLIGDLNDDLDEPNSKLVLSEKNPLIDQASLEHFVEVERLQKGYEYKQSIDETMEWHVNFADEDLFVAYQGGLFAQDEIQVAEMPALAHLKQALLKLYSKNEGYYSAKPKTKLSKDVSSPILIHGIERLCHVKLEKKYYMITLNDASEGRPQGLYGNQFARASSLAVARATELLDDCKVNLICIASLSPSSGYYTEKQIRYLFCCAYTSYVASIVETKRCGFENTTINTGNWGCGAFGGNLELTAVIQILAAILAGIKKLRYYTFDKAGTDGLNKGLKVVHSILNENANDKISDIISKLVAMKFKWSFSNGT